MTTILRLALGATLAYGLFAAICTIVGLALWAELASEPAPEPTNYYTGHQQPARLVEWCRLGREL